MNDFVRLYKNTRYYFIELGLTLFDEIEIRRIFGNINYKNHTGTKIQIYQNKDLAKKDFAKLLNSKLKKGYKFCKTI